MLQGQGQYTWDDGWQFIYANWAPYEPSISAGCILFHPNGTWATVDCASTHHFVCKQTDGTFKIYITKYIMKILRKRNKQNPAG